MCYKLVTWWWRNIRRQEPRYIVERVKSRLNFGPEYHYLVFDRHRKDFLIEGGLEAVRMFLRMREPMNPWLFKKEV